MFVEEEGVMTRRVVFSPWGEQGQINILAAIVAVVIVVVLGILLGACDVFDWRGDGDKPTPTPTRTATVTPTSTPSESLSPKVVIIQEGQSHTLPLELLFQLEGEAIPCFVLEGDNTAKMVVHYGEPGVKFDLGQNWFAGQPEITSLTTDKVGDVSFDLELPLQGRGFGAAKFTLALYSSSGRSAAQFEIAIVKGIGAGGLTGGDTVNSCGELIDMISRLRPLTLTPTATPIPTPIIPGATTTPTPTPATGPVTTAGVRVDPLFLDGFTRYCGFSPSELDPITPVSLDINTVPRHQVAWNGTDFVPAQGVIPVGQWIFTLHATGDRTCVLNPPCGNPAQEGPPKEVMTPTPGTPTPVPTPSPSATPTKTPTPTATPSPTPPPSPSPTPTATPTRTPTATPSSTPTRTPTPTPTPPPENEREAAYWTPNEHPISSGMCIGLATVTGWVETTGGVVIAGPVSDSFTDQVPIGTREEHHHTVVVSHGNHSHSIVVEYWLAGDVPPCAEPTPEPTTPPSQTPLPTPTGIPPDPGR